MKQKRMSLLTVLLAVCAATMAQGLKDVYKDYFLIGVAVNHRNVTNAEQQALIKKEFSSMTAENDMKPEPTEPRQDSLTGRVQTVLPTSRARTASSCAATA